jgi:hypothetical protein
MFKQKENLTLMGLHVKTFPHGIKDTFDSLMNIFGTNRDYYGVSWMDETNQVIYYAMTLETFMGEAILFSHDTLVIEKGEYVTETIHNWLDKTASIKDVFHRLTNGKRPDKNCPCVEWYKSNEEMVCMVRAL